MTDHISTCRCNSCFYIFVTDDSHRVTLDEIPNTEGSDYINASFIEVCIYTS